VRDVVHQDSRVTAEKIAESAGAETDVSIVKIYDTTVKNERLAEWARPVLQRNGRPC
jgi:hypothetical protein